MNKIKLILRPGEFTSFTSYYLDNFWREFFDIEYYDPAKTYGQRRTLFAVGCLNVYNNDTWPAEMRDRGYKVVVDNLWEKLTHRTDFHWIEHPYAFWWNESLWWTALGYDSYRPNKNIQYIGLLQLRKKKINRDLIISHLDSLLDNMLWSYLAKDKRLPNDVEDADSGQRFMHPSWYDQTYCTVVVETVQSLPLFVTEKTYKPLAYYHPYLTLSAPGTLAFLKSAGFETFDNLFDESYDSVDNFNHRLAMVRSNLSGIQLNQGYDNLTVSKLEHNHSHFFNSARIKDSIKQEIVDPLITYAET